MKLPVYGGSAGHLAGVLLCLAVAAYAGVRMLSSAPLAILTWFVGAVLLHDLVLFPAYSALDALVRRALGRRRTPLINHLRVPALFSGLLLLAWWPLIARQVQARRALTTLPDEPYLGRWLAVTGVLFVASAVVYVVRLMRRRENPE